MNGALPLVTDTPMSPAPGNFDTPLVEYDRKRTSLCLCIRVLSTGSTLQVCEAEVQVVSGRRCLGNDGLGKKPRNAGGRWRVILLALSQAWTSLLSYPTARNPACECWHKISGFDDMDRPVYQHGCTQARRFGRVV